MKHLYIIGNGFDLHAGLKTSYKDFCLWLKQNYVFIYENMNATFDIKGDWWNNFEVELGNLDIKRFVKKFSPPEMSEEEILKELEKVKYNEESNLPISLSFANETPCAYRLTGLLDILQYYFEKWVDDCQKLVSIQRYVNLEFYDSFFINFNYTDVLQNIYKIPDDRVVHIHGRASKHNRLIFGHKSYFDMGKFTNPDCQKTLFELSKYEKNPYEYIHKHKLVDLFLEDVEFIHIYGLSFSAVDEDYLNWIKLHTPKNSKWEISWYTEDDKHKINKFIRQYKNIINRVNLIKLEQISTKKNPTI